MGQIWLTEHLHGKSFIEPYKGPLLRSEKFLFHLPEDPEFCIAALAAVEGFVNFKDTENTGLALSGNPYGLFETYVTYPRECSFMISYPPLRRCMDRNDIGDIDLEVYLDPARAIRIAEATSRSIAEGYALMIGAELTTHFPAMLTVGDLHDARPVVVMVKDERLKEVFDEFMMLLHLNFEYLMAITINLGSEVETAFKVIQESAAVIGIQSVETYMACCQKRLVVEIAEGRDRNFMSKWENPYYGLIQVAYGKVQSVAPTSIFRSFKDKAENCRLQSRVRGLRE